MDEPLADAKSFVAAPQVDAAEHYNPLNYLSVSRLASIGYQIQLLSRWFPVGSLLEIGVGSGLTAQLLKTSGFNVRTLDIDKNLNPDLVGSVTGIPLETEGTDLFCCCQVLEHLPWESLGRSLKELHRVCRLGGLISVPTLHKIRVETSYSAEGKRSRKFMLSQAFPQTLKMKDGQHFWELEANVRTEQFKEELIRNGLHSVFDLQAVENPYHHFFVVRKKESNGNSRTVIMAREGNPMLL